MLVILPPLKIKMRVSRPRKVADKAVGKLEGSLTTSGCRVPLRPLCISLTGECPLLAQSGHLFLHRTCPLSWVKRT
jgi:hypothetical protein